MLIRPFVDFHIISHLVLIDLCSPGKSLAAGLTCCVWCADSAYLGGETLLSYRMMLQQSMAKLLLVVFGVGTLFALFCLFAVPSNPRSAFLPEAYGVLTIFPNRDVLRGRSALPPGCFPIIEHNLFAICQ